MSLLHLDSSALGAQSASRMLTRAVVDALKATDPGLTVVYRDLAATPPDHWHPEATRTDSTLLDEFLRADIVVVGAPMYNFSVPSVLKAWIDRIAVAGVTFRYGPHGPEGLAGGKTVIVASTRGGVYAGEMEALDHQERYLRSVFAFLGVTDIRIVRAEGLAMMPGRRDAILDDAIAAFRATADAFPVVA